RNSTFGRSSRVVRPSAGSFLPTVKPASRAAANERIIAVVDRDVDHGWGGFLQRLGENRTQFGRMFHAKTANPECLREAYEVGIVEPGTRHPPELGHLLPSDTPETSVPEDQVHRGGPLPPRRLQLVNAHQESAVSAHGHDPAIRIGELRRDSSREGD